MAGKRGNHEGSIYQSSDGRWRGAVTIGYTQNRNGGVTQVRRVLLGLTRADVAEQMKKIQRDQQLGANIKPDRVELGTHCGAGSRTW